MKIFRISLLAAAAALVSTLPAFADSYTFTLTTPVTTLTPGSTYTFAGTLTAPTTNNADLSIIGETTNGDTGLTFNTDAFNNLPFTLSPGQSISGNFFSVTLASTAAAGSYMGFDTVELDDAAGNQLFQTANLTVNATQGASAVTPEPGSWLLLSTGLGAVGMLRRRFAR